MLSIVQGRLCPGSAESIPLAVDGDAYQLHWRQASSDEPPDISGLPSFEHALYILNTVQFHFSHLYRLFDEKEFLRNLHEFYEDAGQKVQESRIWYVQFLVILAFGDAFLAPVKRASNIASWTKYFSRAMSLLPDVTILWQSGLLSIEVLTLIALYFQSIDMRDTAYCYVRSATLTPPNSWLTNLDWPCLQNCTGRSFPSGATRRPARNRTGRTSWKYLVDSIYS